MKTPKDGMRRAKRRRASRMVLDAITVQPGPAIERGGARRDLQEALRRLDKLLARFALAGLLLAVGCRTVEPIESPLETSMALLATGAECVLWGPADADCPAVGAGREADVVRAIADMLASGEADYSTAGEQALKVASCVEDARGDPDLTGQCLGKELP